MTLVTFNYMVMYLRTHLRKIEVGRDKECAMYSKVPGEGVSSHLTIGNGSV